MEDNSSMTLSEIQRKIAISHLDQLSQMPITADIPVGDQPPIEEIPEEELPIEMKENYFEILERWSNENKKAIRQAIEKGAHGTSPRSVDWECAFLAFMESCAVYLRDEKLVAKAIELYKEAAQVPDGEEKLQEAIDTLDKSVEKIKKLAGMWGIKFRLLCDLVEKHSLEHTWLSGPYCGVFYSSNSAVPYVGVAFKGTYIKNPGDIFTDLYYKPQESGPDILHGAHVSTGVYNGLFGHFGKEQNTPFGLITSGLGALLSGLRKDENIDSATMHITGHSLGGSYSSICYTQYTVKGQLPNLAILGDLYTFGCPRNGEKDFAETLQKHFPKTSSSWRIVNKGDEIPYVLPLLIYPVDLRHVDEGYEISHAEEPKPLSSEINAKGRRLKIPRKGDHSTKDYYTSLQKALSS